MIRWVAYAVATIVATLVLREISEQLISFTTPQSVLIFAVIVGALNAFIKPVLRILTLPLTCLTFGLFAAVLNVALFAAGGWLTPGLDVSLWGAVFGSIIVSLASGIIFSVLDER